MGFAEAKPRGSALKMSETAVAEKKPDFEVKNISSGTINDTYLEGVEGMEGIKRKPRVVILGAGWGGYNFGKMINKDEFEVTLISPRNHFLFTPLLPSTTVGTLEYKCIQEPVRSIKDLKYRQALATNIDFESKKINCRPVCNDDYCGLDYDVEYDQLIVACGMTNSIFKTEGVSQDPVVNQDNHIYFLKSLSDAKRIRNRLIDCFERASNPGNTKEEIDNALNFVIVGGGPTSCEFAGEL